MCFKCSTLAESPRLRFEYFNEVVVSGLSMWMRLRKLSWSNVTKWTGKCHSKCTRHQSARAKNNLQTATQPNTCPHLSHASVLSVVLAIAAASSNVPAMAADFTVLSGTTVGPQVLSDPGDTGLIQSDGTVDNGGAGNAVSMNAADQTLQNSGTIRASGNGFNGVFSQGANATITNDGAIVVTGDNAAGISSIGNFAVITNNGFVNATGNGSDGIFADGELATINNTGTISGRLNGINANTIRRLVNDGIINGELGDGINAFAFENMINTGTITGGDAGVMTTIIDKMTNAGTIIGKNSGIVADELKDLTNSGTIMGRNGPAILETGSVDTTLTLLAGSKIQGAIDLGGGTNTLVVGNGLSIANTFATRPQVIVTNGAPFAVDGNRVAVVDPTLFAMTDEIVTDIADASLNTIYHRLRRLHSDHGTNHSGPALSTPPGQMYLGRGDVGPRSRSGPSHYGNFSIWAHGITLSREQDGDGAAIDADHQLTGLIGGLDARIGRNLFAGLFIGTSDGEVAHEFGTQEEDIDSLFGGLYASTRSGSFTFDMLFSAGTTDHERTRRVANNLAPGGLQTAEADYDGFYVAPELAATVELNLGWFKIEPSARARYLGFFIDGFAESGADDDLVVADRDIHALQGRLQIAFPVTFASGDTQVRFAPRIGVDGRSTLSGDGVDATLLGQGISFDPGGEDDVVGRFAGADLAISFDSGLSLYGSVEGVAEDDSYNVIGHAGARLRF